MTQDLDDDNDHRITVSKTNVIVYKKILTSIILIIILNLMKIQYKRMTVVRECNATSHRRSKFQKDPWNKSLR